MGVSRWVGRAEERGSEESALNLRNIKMKRKLRNPARKLYFGRNLEIPGRQTDF